MIFHAGTGLFTSDAAKNTATSNHAGWTLEKVKPGVNNNAFIKGILVGKLQGGTGMVKIHLQFVINSCQLLSVAMASKKKNTPKGS